MSQNNSEQTRNLEVAFDAFNRMSIQLESSYRDLENQVATLNQELAAARCERLQQLAEKERLADRLERLLDLLPAAVLVLDGEGLITQANPMAESLFEPNLVGQSWTQLMAVHLNHKHTEGVEVILKNNRHVTITRQALGTESGQIVLLMDVSDQHDLKAMLNRQDRLAVMGEMAANLAHQIRTPLSTALLYASNLQRNNMQESDRERMSHKVVDRLKHLEHMVNDMLRFTRGGKFIPLTINIGDLLEQFKQIILPQLEQRHGLLSLPCDAADFAIQGDQEALLGVLLNLANNAIQSVGDYVHITVELTSTARNEIKITFTDNGAGIEQEIAEKVFTPFFTTRSDGTGLGLAVAQATINAHQGEITLISTQGRGAQFEITLPLADNQEILPSGTNNSMHDYQQVRNRRA